MRPAKGWGASTHQTRRGPDVVDRHRNRPGSDSATHQRHRAEGAVFAEQYLEQYGTTKAKVDYNLLRAMSSTRRSKLVLVAAVDPRRLARNRDHHHGGPGRRALQKRGRTPSLRCQAAWAVFGIKVVLRAGYAQVIPRETSTCTSPAASTPSARPTTSLAALLDAHIHNGNELGIDVKITWKRVVDMNDRQLRNIVCGLGGRANGVPRGRLRHHRGQRDRQIFCLATSITDLKERLGRIVVGYLRRPARHRTTTCTPGAPRSPRCSRTRSNPTSCRRSRARQRSARGGPFANIAPQLQLHHGHADGPRAERHATTRGRLRCRPGRGSSLTSSAA